MHIERIRKLPNTRLRRDVEVQRLANYEELELVLSKHPVSLSAAPSSSYLNQLSSYPPAAVSSPRPPAKDVVL